MIQNCDVCIKEQYNKAEPLIPSVLPDRPWQKIGTDLFELKGKPYLVLIIFQGLLKLPCYQRIQLLQM